MHLFRYLYIVSPCITTVDVISNKEQIIYLNAKETQLFQNGSSFFLTKISLSDNAIAKYRYLPYIQYQTQTAVAYGWRAAPIIILQPNFLKSQSSKIVLICEKKTF